MTTVPDYQYQKLDRDNDIRLIKLFPAKRFEDPVRVSIGHHEFTSSRRLCDGWFDHWGIKQSLQLAEEDAEQHRVAMLAQQDDHPISQTLRVLEGNDHRSSLAARLAHFNGTRHNSTDQRNPDGDTYCTPARSHCSLKQCRTRGEVRRAIPGAYSTCAGLARDF
jgi:hypothetical protein